MSDTVYTYWVYDGKDSTDFTEKKKHEERIKFKRMDDWGDEKEYYVVLIKGNDIYCLGNVNGGSFPTTEKEHEDAIVFIGIKDDKNEDNPPDEIDPNTYNID